MPLPDLTPDERRAMDTYEGAVVLCATWVRANVPRHSAEWRNLHGMLDAFARHVIDLRQQLLAGTGYWADPSQAEARINQIVHCVQKLLRSAWWIAPKRDRPRLWPYMKAARELGRGRRVGTWLIDR